MRRAQVCVPEFIRDHDATPVSTGPAGHTGILRRARRGNAMPEPTPDQLYAYLDASAEVLGIPIETEWRDSIRAQLEVTFRLAGLVLDFPLPDEAEPAPVFGA